MDMKNFSSLGGPSLVWLAIVLATLISRSIVPVDETRYVSVAWEMWRHGNFLVPYLNGEPYSQKPPLLFWLINAGWWLWGVNDFWPRLVPALFQLASLYLTSVIARYLWPTLSVSARYAPLILMSFVFWLAYTTAVMFDFLMVFFTLLGALGLILAWQHRAIKGWLLCGLAVGLGVLAKGPVILMYLLPLALLAPWWMGGTNQSLGRWYTGLLGALGLGAAIGLGWAIPAASAGGSAYAGQILFSQTADRMVHSFAHQRPFWWYFAALPVMLFPWILWPTVWKALTGLVRTHRDNGTRFCIAFIIPQLLLFSMISAKQPHYLLPLLPPIALVIARALSSLNDRNDFKRLILPAAGVAMIATALIAASSIAQHRQGNEWFGGLSPGWPVLLLVFAGGIGTIRLHSLSRVLWAVAGCGIVPVFVLYIGVIPLFAPSYDITRMSHYLANLQTRGVPIAHISKYSGQYHFLGRLTKPFSSITDKSKILPWAQAHPNGRIIVYYYKDTPRWEKTKPDYEQYYRGGTVAVWRGKTLIEHREVLRSAHDYSD
jgi:4-amino-4-deoxy-L-arabinose transferase-like glycosyltransferase